MGVGTRVAKRGAQGWMLAHRPATRRRGLPRTAVVDHGGGAGGEKSTSRGRSAIKKIFLMHNLATQIGSSKRGGLDEQAIRHCIVSTYSSTRNTFRLRLCTTRAHRETSRSTVYSSGPPLSGRSRRRSEVHSNVKVEIDVFCVKNRAKPKHQHDIKPTYMHEIWKSPNFGSIVGTILLIIIR